MKIEDLDEFEGLTADMVRDWLRAKGWELREVGNGFTDAVKRFGEHRIALGFMWETSVPWLLSEVTRAEGISPQSLLREINPRMRTGVPDSESVRAHENGEGWWCARTPGGILRIGKFTPMLCFTIEALHGWQTASPHQVASWSFWPCDAHGNKVRRGTVA